MIYYRCTWAWTDENAVLKPGRVYEFRDEESKAHLLGLLLTNGYKLEETTEEEYKKQQLQDALK